MVEKIIIKILIIEIVVVFLMCMLRSKRRCPECESPSLTEHKVRVRRGNFEYETFTCNACNVLFEGDKFDPANDNEIIA
jgi:rubredoxin